MAIASQDTKDFGARHKVYMALKNAGATSDSLSGSGVHYSDMKEGYLAAWQGEKFALIFSISAAKVMLKGKVVDNATGSRVEVTQSKEAWQRALSSKAGKARNAYLAWLDGEKKATTKGKDAAIASFADLCAKELQALHNRAEKDEADHGEFQVALIRAADLIGLAWANGKFAAKK